MAIDPVTAGASRGWYIPAVGGGLAVIGAVVFMILGIVQPGDFASAVGTIGNPHQWSLWVLCGGTFGSGAVFSKWGVSHIRKQVVAPSRTLQQKVAGLEAYAFEKSGKENVCIIETGKDDYGMKTKKTDNQNTYLITIHNIGGKMETIQNTRPVSIKRFKDLENLPTLLSAKKELTLIVSNDRFIKKTEKPGDLNFYIAPNPNTEAVEFFLPGNPPKLIGAVSTSKLTLEIVE